MLKTIKKWLGIKPQKPDYVWVLEYTYARNENYTYLSAIYFSLEDAFKYHPVNWQPSCLEEPPTEYQYRSVNPDAVAPYDPPYRLVAILSKQEVK